MPESDALEEGAESDALEEGAESDALEEGAGNRCSECVLVSVPGKLSHAHRHFREATSAKRSPVLS